MGCVSCDRRDQGRQYLSGWLGKASVVAFAGEPDRHGNPTWDLFISSPEPRSSDATSDRRSPSAGSGNVRSNGDAHRAPRRESEQARHDRVAGEVAERYGVRRDADLDDDIPF